MNSDKCKNSFLILQPLGDDPNFDDNILQKLYALSYYIDPLEIKKWISDEQWILLLCNVNNTAPFVTKQHPLEKEYEINKDMINDYFQKKYMT